MPHSSASPARRRPARDERVGPAAVGEAPGQTILIVEDDPAIRALIAATLGRPGRRLVEVGEGPAAVAAAHDCQPDLVLLDVGLPGLDGFGVCEQLRADPKTREAHIMFLTARTAPVDRERAMAVGADEYLQKPFSPMALRAAIERRLAPPSGA
jgi:CheY-like chemotaxis protein